MPYCAHYYLYSLVHFVFKGLYIQNACLIPIRSIIITTSTIKMWMCLLVLEYFSAFGGGGQISQ